jgi:hypothetical protein
MNIAVSGMGMNAATLAAPVGPAVVAAGTAPAGAGLPIGGAGTQSGELSRLGLGPVDDELVLMNIHTRSVWIYDGLHAIRTRSSGTYSTGTSRTA